MNPNYTPQQALELLLRIMTQRQPIVAQRMREAIAQGKEIQKETNFGRRTSKSKTTFLQKVPYSYEEALGVALDVLQAHFLEVTLFLNSAFSDFSVAAEFSPRSKGAPFQRDASPSREMALQVAQATETILAIGDEAPEALEPISFEHWSESLIEAQKESLADLRKRLTF